MAGLLRAVAEEGYTEPTPIQAKAIPVVLAGRDLLAAAQTGTGKTAGFTLPIIQRLSAAPRTTPRGPRALVLVPTRELAAQVNENLRAYGRHMPLKSITIFGGVGFNPQVSELRRGLDVVIATPGRLLDHIGQRTIDLRSIEVLVLDEADRMLDMGFVRDVRKILAVLPAKRQNLLFSATFSTEIRALSREFLHDPVTVEVSPPNKPVELIGQVVHPVDQDRKRELLAKLVKDGDWQQVLVFTRTKHGANRLAEQLVTAGIDADAIHGNKSQPQRVRALKRFKDGEMQVLVATDIAARGLDIEALPHVVNFDLPHVAEDYVHRIGRTGRAGASGEAVTLLSGEDRTLMNAIERLIGREVEQRVIAGFEPSAAWRHAKAEPQQRGRGGQQHHRAGAPQRSGRPHGGAPAGRGGAAGRGGSAGRGDSTRGYSRSSPRP